MKIAQVCHRYYPNIGGVETHVREISKRLAKKHEMEIICADLSPENRDLKEVDGIRVRRFGSISPKDAYFFSPQIFSYLKRVEFAIIHAHNYHAFPALFASLVKGKSKFVFTPHYHGTGSTVFRSILHKPYNLLASRIFERADKIICVSNFEKNLIKRDFPSVLEEKMSVISNGIDIEKIKEAKPFDFDGNLILYIGRLEKYKNIHLVIRAMEFLLNSHFYIIGGAGNYRNELENLIYRLNLGKRVKILDNVSDEEKYRWLKTCSLFINPSSIEAFGITVIEALAAGKTVVVNHEGGLIELADKFDDVFPVRVKKVSAEELARMMEERMGKKVKADLGEYDWDNVAKRIEDVYLEVGELT